MKFLVFSPIAQKNQKLHELLTNTDNNLSIRQVIETQTEKITHEGQTIDNKASELAINSAEIRFFLDKLATAIEDSGQDVDRRAAAAEQMSLNTRTINDNAALAAEQATHFSGGTESIFV